MIVTCLSGEQSTKNGAENERDHIGSVEESEDENGDGCSS